MACKLQLQDAANRLAHAAGARFPFPDATRASSPAGRRAVSDFTMNVITSDAALHQMRYDLKAAGVEVNANENFVDAMGNVGNMVGDAQNRENNQYIAPLVAALRGLGDKYGITGAEARKQLAVDIGRYREALHAIERQAVFTRIKGKFVGHDAPTDTEAFAAAKAASAARKALNNQFDKGAIDADQYEAELDRILKTHPIDLSTTTDLGGMALDVADKVIAELGKKAHVKAGYAELKPYIDRVFDRVTEIYVRNGKIDERTLQYHKLYGFSHYAPVYSADDHDNLNMANYLDNISPNIMDVAGGGIPGERIPFFPALNIQLNAAAKFSAENEASAKVYNFAKAHGKKFGMAVKGGKPVYSVGDSGHEVRKESVPPNSLPFFAEGKMYWVEFNTRNNKANSQLFQAIKNRMTNQFAAKSNPVDNAVRGVITHAPARLFTNLNPYFWFNSMVRDPLGVAANVFLENRIKNKGKVLARAFSLMTGDFNHVQAQKYFQRDPELREAFKLDDLQDTSLVRDYRAEGVDGEFASWVKDLARHGGETIFNRAFYTADYTGVAAGTDLNTAMPWRIGGSIDGVSGAATKLGEAGSEIIHRAGNLVSAFDMQARVAVYRALLEQNPGMGKTEAAAIVREFMDFSQKPLNPSVFSTVVPFFRTSTVGAYRAWESLMYDEAGNFKPKTKEIAIMIAVGYMMALGAKDGDDDNGVARGDKIAHSRAFSTVTLGYNEDGTARSIPLPYGPAALFVGMGNALERMTSGVHDRGDVMAAFGAHVMRNMTPLAMSAPGTGEDSGDSFLGALAHANPIMGTAAELWANKDAFGRPIYNDNPRAEGTEDWSDAKLGTPELWLDLAHHLYSYSGGLVDVHPETFEYLVKQWTPFASGKFAAAELDKADHRDLGSPDPNDHTPLWQDVVGSVFLDKSPNYYWFNQYQKSMGMYQDMQNRVARGWQPNIDQQRYMESMSVHEAWINHLKGSMRDMTEEQKFEALMALRQNQNAVGVAGLKMDKAAAWKLMALE